MVSYLLKNVLNDLLKKTVSKTIYRLYNIWVVYQDC
jgi:hypothetical protein